MQRIFLTDREKTGDLGEGAVSYIAVILLVAGIVAAVVSTDLGGKVTSKIELAVCRVGSSDCPSTDAPQGTRTQGVRPTEGTWVNTGTDAYQEAYRQALSKWLDQHGYTLRYRQGEGATWDPITKTLSVGKSLYWRGNDATKALNDMLGLADMMPWPDVNNLSRDEYVKRNADARTSIASSNMDKEYTFAREMQELSPQNLDLTYEIGRTKTYDDAYAQGGRTAARKAVEKEMRQTEAFSLRMHWDDVHNKNKRWSCGWIFC
jgi:hypothetical protein